MTKEFERQRKITLALAHAASNQVADFLYREWLAFGSIELKDNENPNLQLIRYSLKFAEQLYGKAKTTKI